MIENNKSTAATSKSDPAYTIIKKTRHMTSHKIKQSPQIKK